MTPTSPCAFAVSDSISSRPLTCTRGACHRASTWLYTTAYKSLCGTWSNPSRPFIRIFCTCTAMDGRSEINRQVCMRYHRVTTPYAIFPSFSRRIVFYLRPKLFPCPTRKGQKRREQDYLFAPRRPFVRVRLPLARCSQSLHCRAW